MISHECGLLTISEDLHDQTLPLRDGNAVLKMAILHLPQVLQEPEHVSFIDNDPAID
jgi:hypothetical protein